MSPKQVHYQHVRSARLQKETHSLQPKLEEIYLNTGGVGLQLNLQERTRFYLVAPDRP